ncbi:hypothetical protein [Spiroplasma poulsonii]|uniref:Uncharacterized protein n=1 Tax=Spiroplasma poulsonii TaxID=2138 RepID=A0A2P6FBX4_9MOLU|nr:hypothetical protein [Spiroplasma poulsonii]PQM30940.1 hypothetical protein SMSRO_SF007330 [Spiroplasma poulsonii]PWF98710.1 hypothetical protein SMH99_12720 [Spiroplasma poulsonii]
MNKFLKHIIKKIRFSLSLFIPGTFNPLRSKYENETEFDYAYILTNSIHQENVINETEVTLINEENNCQYNKQIIRKINRFSKPNQNVLLVCLGFVVWFFKFKKSTLPPQVW